MMAPVQRGDVGVRAGQGHQSPDDAAQRGQPLPEPLTTARRAWSGQGSPLHLRHFRGCGGATSKDREIRERLGRSSPSPSLLGLPPLPYYLSNTIELRSG